MVEEKESFVTGLKDEAIEQGVHFAASEGGKGIRSFLEGMLSPETLRVFASGGLLKIISNVAAFLVRAVLPDSKNGELLKDAVTEVMNEAFDFGEGAKGSRGGSAGASAQDASAVPNRRVPVPRRFTYAVLGATQEVLGELAAFIEKVYASNEHGGEKEVENIFAWLSTLSQAELVGFSTLTFSQKIAIWKAQKDPKEEKRWQDTAKGLAETAQRFLKTKFNNLDAAIMDLSQSSREETQRLEERVARLRKESDRPLGAESWKIWKL